MSEVWPDEELTRKNELLAPESPLRQNAQTVIACAECILARPLPGAETPSFTSTEIQRCTKLSQAVVSFTLEKAIRSGWAVKEPAPEATLNNRKPPVIYRPVVKADGTSFFRPAARPGCERTAQQNILEPLTPTQRMTLACLGHMTAHAASFAESELTQPKVNRCLYTDPAVTRVVFHTLQKAGVIKRTDNKKHGVGRLAYKYVLTEKGEWLTRDMPPLDSCQLAAKKLASGLEDSMPLEDFIPLLAAKIRADYPAAAQNRIMQTVVRHHSLGVLRIAAPGETPLTFTLEAAQRLGPIGQKACAHWLGLDILLYGQPIPPAHLRSLLRMPKDAKLGHFIAEQYYKPLLSYLEE